MSSTAREYRAGVPRTFPRALGEIEVVRMLPANIVGIAAATPSAAVYRVGHDGAARALASSNDRLTSTTTAADSPSSCNNIDAASDDGFGQLDAERLRQLLGQPRFEPLRIETLRCELFDALDAEVRQVAANAGLRPKDGLYELTARWLLHHFNHSDYAKAVTNSGLRSWVVAGGDVGRRVQLVATPQRRGAVVATASMANKQFWVDVRLDDGTVARVDVADVRLEQPVPLYVDFLLPCGEIEGYGWSKLLVSTLVAFAGGLDAAVGLVTRLTSSASLHRERLANAITRERTAARGTLHNGGGTTSTPMSSTGDFEGEAAVELTSAADSDEGDDHYALTFRGVAHEILGRHLRKLRSTFVVVTPATSSRANDGSNGNEQTGGDVREPAFLAAVFAVLSRYRAMFGPQDRNQGAHAAVPPVVVRKLRDEFGTCFDCFGNPLNANTEFFCSLFPDTDRFFGSVGRFFDIRFVRGTFGCNPPYDSPTMKKTADHVLSCLGAAAEGDPLSFTIVIPKWDDAAASDATNGDGDGGGPRRERATSNALMSSAVGSLTSSAYLAAETVLEAARTPYLDGHQHLIECPYFTIRSDTRLIVLQNYAARRLWPDAGARLERVRQEWYGVASMAQKSTR